MPRTVVIDDSHLILDLLRLGLRTAGHEVVTAPSAAEGLEAIRREKPDLVLLDLEMPGSDGLSCLASIRADSDLGRLPVIMISAHPVRDVIVRVAQLGVQGIILKNDRLLPSVLDRVVQVTGRGPAARAQPLPGGNAPQPEPARSRSAIAPAPAPRPKPSPPSAPSAADEADSLSASVLQLDGQPLDLEEATQRLKDLKPLMSRTELMDRVLTGVDLRAMAPAVHQVLQLTQSSTSSLDAVAKAIRQDQALSLKMLKVANSPLFARGERVENVHKAVARIGVSQVRSTVLSLAVIDQFSAVALADRINAEWFWEHSIACGMIAQRIARLRGVKPDQADSLFTAGLLHDVGRVIFAEQLGETYSSVLDTADRLQLPLETVESRLLLINHADLTDRLLRQWNFSAELINPIALHHLSVGNIRRMAPRMIEEVATLGLANRLAHAMLLGCSGNDVLYPLDEFVQVLGLRPAQVTELCDRLPDDLCDLRIAMLSHASGPARMPTYLDHVARSMTVPLRPLVIAAAGTLDPINLLCQRLCAAAADQPRYNIALVRLNSASERVALINQLRAAEAEAEIHQPLPVLVVAAGVACRFADGMLNTPGKPPRRVETLPVPLRLGRLIHAMQSMVQAVSAAQAA